MDDASKLGPLWVGQLRKEVAGRRNRAAENLLTINPDGDFAKQHRMLIKAADVMLEAEVLLDALRGAESLIDTLALACLDRVDSINDPRRAAITAVLNSLAEDA
jgi:hypothetical protein